MILEHHLEFTSARWDKENNRWDVGRKKLYRWCYPDETPATDYFDDIQKALDWIIEYDKNRI